MNQKEAEKVGSLEEIIDPMMVNHGGIKNVDVGIKHRVRLTAGVITTREAVETRTVEVDMIDEVIEMDAIIVATKRVERVRLDSGKKIREEGTVMAVIEGTATRFFDDRNYLYQFVN